MSEYGELREFRQNLLEADRVALSVLEEEGVDLKFDRTKLGTEAPTGLLMNYFDFELIFGVRPIEIEIHPRELFREFKCLVPKHFKYNFEEDRLIGGSSVGSLRFDRSTYLIHPKHVLNYMNFYRITDLSVFANYFVRILIARRDEEDTYPIIKDFCRDNFKNPMFGFVFNILMDEDTNHEYLQGQMINSVFESTILSLRDSPFYSGRRIEGSEEMATNYFETMLEENKGSCVKIRFTMDRDFASIEQPDIPSRAELEQDYKDYMRDKKLAAGPKIKVDKRKQKNKVFPVYSKKGNLNQSFWNPNPRLRELKITHETMQVFRKLVHHHNKPIGFWTREVQSYFQEEFLYGDSKVTINNALQVFSNFKANRTGTDEESAIGSMQGLYRSRRQVNFEFIRDPVANMKEAWDVSLQSHYRNAHHPEHTEDRIMSVKATIELWFDLLASGMRITNNANEAFYKIQPWVFEFKDNNALVKEKFAKLNPIGTLFFLAAVSQRGLSLDDCKQVHPRLRNAPLTKEEEKIDLLSLYNAQHWHQRSQRRSAEFLQLPKVKDYLNETRWHCALVDRELLRYRIATGHDADKFDFPKVVAYVWMWSWPKVSGTSDEEICTCFRLMKCPNHTFDEFIDIKTSIIGHASKDYNPFEYSDAESSFSEDSSKELRGNLFTRAVHKTKTGIENAFTKMNNKVMQPISAPLAKATDEVLKILNHMHGLIDKIYTEIQGLIKKFISIPLPNLSDMSTILSLILDYIIFVNVDNVLLKGAIIISALSKIGITNIFEKASKYFKSFMEATNEEEELVDSEVEGTSSEGDPDETSFWTKVVTWVSDINPKNAGIMAALLITGLVGYMQFGSKKEIINIGTKIVNGMRNISFVGMGFVGLGNIVKYVISMFKEIASWLCEKVGILTPEQKKIEKQTGDIARIVEWDTHLSFYYTRDGMELVKMNKDKFIEARKVALEWWPLNALTYRPDSELPPEVKKLIRDNKKRAVDLINFLHRLDATTSFRQTPFHVQFYGAAGIGKSFLLKKLVNIMHAKYFSTVDLSKFVYSPNVDKEHWDGYWGQPCIIVDEMWQVLDAETLVEWLTLISCMPVLLPMANLEDKEQYFKSKLILSNTNVPHPRANGVACIDAVHRRRHLLVEVISDPRVIDVTQGQFSEALFQKFYPGQNSFDYPHLTFNLMKPVLEKPGADAYYQDSTITLPGGVTTPTKDFKIDHLINIMFGRYDYLVKSESSSEGSVNIYEEWRGMCEDVFDNYNITSLPKKRDWFSSNVTTLPYEAGQVEIPNGKEIKMPDVKISKKEVEEIFEENQPRKEFSYPLLKFKFDEEMITYDLNKECVITAKGTEAINEKWLQILLLHQNCDSLDEVKAKFSGVTGTSDEVNHSCKLEVEKHRMSWKDASRLNLSNMAYMEHCKKCRGYYSHEEYVEFIVNSEFPSVPSIQTLVDMFNKSTNRYEKYRLGMRLLRNASCGLKQQKEFYYHLGSEELCGDAPVYQSSENKPYLLTLREGFERITVDQLKSAKLVCGEYVTDRCIDYDWMVDNTNFFNDWDRIVLSKKERAGIFAGFPERLDISYVFLESIHESRGIYYLKMNKKMRYYGKIAASVLNHPNAQFEPVECTYLVTYPWFWRSYIAWFNLSSEQRNYLISGRGLRFKLYQTFAEARYYLYKSIQKAYDVTLGKFFGTIKYIWKKYNFFFKTLGIIGSAYATIFLFQNLGKLFSGTEGTSKVYFKTKPRLPFKVTGTSSELEENFLQGIKGNIFEVIRDDTKVRANAIGVSDHIVLCNHHFIKPLLDSKQEYATLTMRPTAKSLDWIPYIIETKHIHNIPETDLSLIYSESFPCFKKIIHKFRTEDQVIKHEINQMNLYYNHDGVVKVREYQLAEIAPFISYTNRGDKVINSKAIHYKGQPESGSSGGILYSPDKYCNSFILGIQCWKDGKRGYGNLVTREDLQSALDKFKNELIVEHAGPYELVEGTSKTEELITSHVEVLGVVPEEHILGIVHKSSFEETPIASYFPSERIPAILRAMDERVPEGSHPLQHSVNKTGRDIMRPLDPNLLNHSVKQLECYYQNKLRNSPLRLLSFDETLTGLPVDGNVAMNSKTSPGIPWIYKRKSPGKKDFLRFTEEGDIEFCAEEVRTEFKRIEKELMKGKIPLATMYEFPKDELRPKDKALGPPIKTRSISVLNFVFNLIWRKYCLSLESALHQQADGTNEYCIGINPESLAWTRIYHSLQVISKDGVDLDVGNWDGHYTIQLMSAAVDLTSRLYEHQNIGGRCVRRALVDHNVFGCTQFLDIVLRKNRGLPSGCAGTGHLNTFGHIILTFYMFSKMWKEQRNTLPTYNEFKKLVSFFVYGDDIMMSIHETIQPWYNGKTISEMYTHYGWPTTSALKTGNTNLLVPIYRLTFLKRYFVKHPIQNIILGALDPVVIYDLFHWMRRTANHNEQFYENIRSALEFAWFYGPERYESVRAKLNNALYKEGLPVSEWDYETMDFEMMNRITDDCL